MCWHHCGCRITVKSLSERTDLQALAAEIVDKCKLIHPSKVRPTAVAQAAQQQHQSCICSSTKLVTSTWSCKLVTRVLMRPVTTAKLFPLGGRKKSELLLL